MIGVDLFTYFWGYVLIKKYILFSKLKSSLTDAYFILTHALFILTHANFILTHAIFILTHAPTQPTYPRNLADSCEGKQKRAFAWVLFRKTSFVIHVQLTLSNSISKGDNFLIEIKRGSNYGRWFMRVS